jgi:hypothetical protein
MKKKYNFVYIITNLINGKQYIGDHSTNDLDDQYLGGGIYLSKAKKKYGKQSFELKIIEFFPTKQEAFNIQEKYINEYNTLSPNGYNISPKGGLGVKECHSKKTCKKISKSLTGKKHTEEQRKNQSNAHKGKTFFAKNFGDTHGKNNGMFGKSVYQLWIEKFGIEEANRLKEECKIKLSNSLKGKNKGKPKAYDVWVKKYGVEEADKLFKELSKKLSDSHKGKGTPSKFKNICGKDSPVYKQISKNDLTKIIELYEKGMGCREISQFFNQKYSIYKIRRALKEDHVYVKRKNTPKRKLQLT